jgi:hypothetical protein
MHATNEQRGLLRLAGGLLLAGFVLFALVTQLFHPSQDENNHPVIFGKYDASDAWVAVHFGQFVAVLIALGGVIALHRFLETRGRDVLLARMAFAATIATAAVWAVLQAVDGTALKEATDAWGQAVAAQKDLRFADAETVRWTEWGLQSYFRLLMGLTFALFGTAVARTGIVARWAGFAGILAGLAYATIGVAVGHTGFEKPGAGVVQLLMGIFVSGVLYAGFRGRTGARQAAQVSPA